METLYDVRSNVLTVNSSRPQSNLHFMLFLGMSLLASVSGLILLPLWVEDVTVLFHRANYTDLPTFFTYAGYVSAHPQLIAQLVSGLQPVAQATVYAFCALIIWGIMLFYLVRAGVNKFLLACTFAYFFVFDSLYLYNLTYSLWPAVVTIGLASLVALEERRQFYLSEIALLSFLSLASPLSLFFALSTFSVAWMFSQRNPIAYIPFIFCLLSYVLLADSSGQSLTSKIGDLSTRLAALANEPFLYFKISGNRLPISPPNLVRSASLGIAVLFLIMYALPQVRARYGNYIFFAFGAFSILAVSTIKVPPGEVLRARYYFPVIIFALCLLSAIVARGAIANRIERFSFHFSSIIFVGAVVAGVFEKGDVKNLAVQFANFSSFRWSQEETFLIHRPGQFNKNDWTVALGDFYFSEEQCERHHPRGESFVFQVYCSSGHSIKVHDFDGSGL